MSAYRDQPEAIRSLVQPDRVHRDLYLSEELFALEQERFFAATWVYVGHASEVPQPGDYRSLDVAGQPLVMVRHPDGAVRVLSTTAARTRARGW